VWFSANDYYKGTVMNEYMLKRGADLAAWKDGLAVSRAKIEEMYGETRTPRPLIPMDGDGGDDD
jgi:hypothetical protein